jgi:hypothetical protein
MSDRFSCHDKDSLIAYLYDEVEDPLRREIDEHLLTCSACSDEVGALAEVRIGLSVWTPPQTELGITIARKSDIESRANWWSNVPVWAQVAAAALVFAVGVSVANVQVRSNADGFVVTTGWMSPAPAAASSSASAPSDEQWKPALAALESQLRNEIQAARPQPVQAAAMVSHASDSDATLKQVQTMLTASELRQRQELALRLTQLTRDMDVQRRADLVRISQGFGQFEGRTGEMMARQRQMMNYVMRVSGQPPQ